MLKRGYLLVEKGLGSGLTYPLGEQPMVIGRGRRCEVHLDDSWCSREHCVLELRDGQPWLSDLGSKNGTSVNGVPVESWRMRPGDRLILGQTTLIYLEEEEDISRGEISLEEDEDTETLDPLKVVALDPEETEAGSWSAPPAPEPGGLLAVVNRIADQAQSAARLEQFFEQTLAELVAGTAAVDGALALVDEQTRELTSQVTCRPGGRFVLKTQLVDAVINRREVSVVGKRRGGRFVGAPIWIEGRVAGLLCLKLPGTAPIPDQQFLLLMGVLGNVVGGTVQNIRRVRDLQQQKTTLQRGIQSQFDMIGQSPPMKKIYGMIERVAASDAAVLISGESGTGKELVARAIHYRSARGEGPFVTLNAASLPLELVESDLFGHVKGAFTGAVRDKPGKFEAAHGGTFFLDEVGELDIRVQAKLLRVLEDGSFQRVGDTGTRTSDARVITATNRDLLGEVAAERFREDLLYRLRVLELRLPPLRERPGDIRLLVSHFVSRFAEEMGKRMDGASEEALARLEAHPWPGNVRELRNCVERAMVMTAGRRLEPGDLDLLSASAPAEPMVPSLREMERAHVQRILQLTGGNKSKAARMLGIDRSTLYQKLREIAQLDE